MKKRKITQEKVDAINRRRALRDGADIDGQERDDGGSEVRITLFAPLNDRVVRVDGRGRIEKR